MSLYKVKKISFSILISWIVFIFVPSIILDIFLAHENFGSSAKSGLTGLIGIIASIVIAYASADWKTWKRIAFVPFTYVCNSLTGSILLIPLGFLKFQNNELYNFGGYTLSYWIYFSYFIYLKLSNNKKTT